MKKKRHLILLFAVIAALGWGMFVLSRSNDKIDENEMVMYSAISSKPDSLDPATESSVTSEIIVKHIYDTLYDYDYLKRPYVVVPVLADSMPDVSADGLTCIIKIKKGLFFSDDGCFKDGKGRELTVNDVIYSWKRIANIKNLSPSWWVFDERIVGLDEFREYTKTCALASDVDYSREVEGLKAIDDYALQVRLKKAWPHMVYNLTKGATTAVAKEAVDYYGKTIVNHPIGTGPYILKQWNKESYIELERNPKYNYGYYPTEGEDGDFEKGLLADAGKKIPFIDRVYFVKIEEEPPSWFLFLKGKLDSSYIPKDNFDQAISDGKKLTPEMKKRGIELKMYRLPDTSWIGFNMDDPIVGNNKPLRQAISHILDKKRFIDLFANGTLDEAFGLIPPIMQSYNEELSKTPSYNVAKAKELMEQAKKIYGGDIPELTLKMPGTSVSERQYGQFFQKEFDKIGLKLNIDYLDAPMYFAELNKGQFQMYFGGVSSSAPIAYNILRMFHSKSIQSGNHFYYRNEEFDRTFDKASIMVDCPERTELYRKCEKILLDDCVAVFIFHSVSYTLSHSWVENDKPSALQYGLARFIKIDSAKRRSYQAQY